MALLPKIKLKTIPTFPSVINGGIGIDTTKQNGAVTVDLKYSDFGVQSNTPTSPTNSILTYDTATGSYIMIPTSLLGGAVAGISDAPVDGFQYGRQSAGWTRVTGISDAPNDGTQYGRKSAGWTPITSGSFIQAGTGAVTRTMQDKARDIVNVRDFGAVGNGVADDTVAIQAAINSLTNGGVVHIPVGTYNISAEIKITQQTTNFADTARVSLFGAGSGLTRLKWVGSSSSGNALTWTTTTTTNTDGTYGNSWARMGGFYLDANSLVANGIYVLAKSWFEMDDIRVTGSTSRNFWFDSTVSWSGRGLRSYGSNIGMYFVKSTDPLAYSTPNNITLTDTTIGNATSFGVFATDAGPINFIGCSFEANGTQGTDLSGGVYFRHDPTSGIESVQGNFIGCYFENNGGGADIYLSQQSNTLPAIVHATGCNFHRISSSNFTTNNLRVELLGSMNGVLNIDSCGFSSAGSYVASSSRRCIAMTGNIGNAGNAINVGKGCTFLTTADNADDLNGPWAIPSGYVFAAVRCASNGSIVRKHNIFSVTKTGTGTYAIQFTFAAATGNPQVSGTIVGGAGTLSVTGETAGTITVQTRDTSGTVTDQAFSAIFTNAL